MPRKALFGILLLGVSAYFFSQRNDNSAGTRVAHGFTAQAAATEEDLSADDSPSSGEEAQDGEMFDGTPCTYDCSGHQAGYEWADRKDIDDEDDCDTAGINSNSPSFAEGCKAYVQENAGINGPDSGSDDNEPDSENR